MDWASSQTGSGPALYQSFMAPGLFGPFAEALVAEVGIGPGDRVLDVACGTGMVSRTAAAAAGAEGSVTGVDLGEPMLAVAIEQPNPDGSAPIEYLQGSADSLPVDDAAFDAALCQQGLQFFPDRPAAVAELRRALAPGGRLGIATWSGIERNPVMEAISQGLAEGIGEEAGQMMHAPFALRDPGELRGLVEDAGFAAIEVRERTLETTFPSHDQAARTIILAGPIAPAFMAATGDQQEAVVAEATGLLARYRTEDGGLSAPMTTLELRAVSP